MKVSYFNTLVQDTHSESNGQAALPGVVPGMVCAAPAALAVSEKKHHAAPRAVGEGNRRQKSLT